MTYHVLVHATGEFVTVTARDRPHIMVFHDHRLSMRCLDGLTRAWPDIGAMMLVRLAAVRRTDALEQLRSAPEMPPDMTFLFVDDMLFLDLVEDIARLARNSLESETTP
ncbi:hypothetical protein [Micromonospora taraxaci]|uniref:hypothetical protein n=1 Tax=Micromonospora taraxaci TaxID=1316803 RepID=UPI0033A9442A